MNNKDLEVDLKLEINDKSIFIDYKRFLLLRYIDELGSITKASQKSKIPYRSALKYVEDMEEQLDSRLLITQRGGKGGGGGSKLTKTGKSVIWEYFKLTSVLQKHRMVNEITGLITELDDENKIMKIILDTKVINLPINHEFKVGDAVLVLISPEDILVMLEPHETSLRNLFQCKIVGMELIDDMVRLSVILDGISLMVDITQQSREILNLNLGKEIFIGFKATATSVIKI